MIHYTYLFQIEHLQIFLKKEVKKASLQNLAPWYYYYLFTVKWIKEGQDLAMVSPSTELCASHVGVL